MPKQLPNFDVSKRNALGKLDKSPKGSLDAPIAPLEHLPTPEAEDALAKRRAEAAHRRTDGFAVSLGPFERVKPREKVAPPPRPPPLLDVSDWGEQLLAHVIVREGVTDEAGGAGVRADADAPLEKPGGADGGAGGADGGGVAPTVGAPRLAAYERDAPFRGDVKSNASARRRLDNEIRVLQRVRHPHIVRLFETFESPKRIHLVMEYVSHGTLYRHLKKHKKLAEPEARRLFRQLVGALAYLHSRFISHRDIKLENVLLDHRRDVRLIDFGFAILSRSKLRVPCGSPSYTAPEIVAHKEYDGPVADVWSLGVLLYVLLAGRFPFQGTTRDDLSRNIMRGVFALPQHLSPPPDELLKRMLVTDAGRRYNIENVRQHAWLARAPGEAEICAEHAAAPAADGALKSRLVAAIGFPADAVDASVAADRPDHVFTTYLLLKRQLERDAPGAGGDDAITEVEELGVS